MKKFILYALASVGGFFVGLIAGFVVSLIVIPLVYLTFDSNVLRMEIMDVVRPAMPYIMRTCGAMGAIALPYLLRDDIRSWL